MKLNHLERDKEGDSTSREGVDEDADDADPNVEHDDNDEKERALPGNVRPGVSLWLVGNVASGLCATFLKSSKDAL